MTLHLDQHFKAPNGLKPLWWIYNLTHDATLATGSLAKEGSIVLNWGPGRERWWRDGGGKIPKRRFLG